MPRVQGVPLVIRELPVTPTARLINYIWEIIRRALMVTVRSIERVWAGRPAISDDWPVERENALLSELRAKKATADLVLVAFVEQQVPPRDREKMIEVRLSDTFIVRR